MSNRNFSLQPKPCTLKPRRGFTLIEVLVSIVILVVVIGGVVALESGNIKTGTSSKFSIQANGVGQQAFNMVKSLGDRVKLEGSHGNVCKDPNVLAGCPAGVYYLESSELKLCTNCKNMSAIDQSEKLCSTFTTAELKKDNLICTDAGATGVTLDNKSFQSTVIFP